MKWMAFQQIILTSEPVICIYGLTNGKEQQISRKIEIIVIGMEEMAEMLVYNEPLPSSIA